jgi:uncharacterized membrane protein YkvA (DUF1232 family)
VLDVVYDDLFNLISNGVGILGYMDDITLVVVDSDLDRVGSKTKDSQSLLNDWFEKKHFPVVHKKIEFVLLTLVVEYM